MKFGPRLRRIAYLAVITNLIAGCAVPRNENDPSDINAVGTPTPIAGIPTLAIPTAIPNPPVDIDLGLPEVSGTPFIEVTIPTAIPNSGLNIDLGLPDELSTPFIVLPGLPIGMPVAPGTPVPVSTPIPVPQEMNLEYWAAYVETKYTTMSYQYTGPTLAPIDPQDNYVVEVSFPTDSAEGENMGPSCTFTSDALSYIQNGTFIRLTTFSQLVNTDVAEQGIARIYNAYREEVYSNTVDGPDCEIQGLNIPALATAAAE
jgi:hypothetical protein